MLVAVYGTLKRGRGNNRLLSTSSFIGEDELHGFTMYSAGGFPVIYRSEELSKSILVEVWEVDEETLTGDLDRLEGHPSWYCRELVPTKYGEAWIYIMRSQSYARDNNLILSGEF